MPNPEPSPGPDRRKARTELERMALCVLRADLPRLGTVLDAYSRCITEMVASLGATDAAGAGGPADRRRQLVARLHAEHEAVLGDLERLVAALERGGLASGAPKAGEGTDDRRSERGDAGSPPSPARRIRRERGWWRSEPGRRKRAAGDT